MLQAANHINNDLDSLVMTSENHHLKINSSKSCFIIFGQNRENFLNNFKLKVKGNELVYTKTARNLGLLFDENLRFSSYISNTLKKCYAGLKTLFPHRHILSQDLKIKLCDTLVLSHFNYCDTVYGPCLTKADECRIQRVQKSCLRYIYGIRKYDSVSFKLKNAKWLNMLNRRKLHAATLYHSIIISKIPPYLYNKITFRSDVHNLNLRFKGMLSPPSHHTVLFRRSFSYNIYSLYNGLSLNLKNLNLLNFKFKFKANLFDSQF